MYPTRGSLRVERLTPETPEPSSPTSLMTARMSHGGTPLLGRTGVANFATP
jgi:hypothetical protein